jgi:hypothetical protein
VAERAREGNDGGVAVLRIKTELQRVDTGWDGLRTGGSLADHKHDNNEHNNEDSNDLQTVHQGLG